MLNKLKKGFTLIELLVVVAILGIIAVGLIVAIDPVEQVNRATDSSRRALATDFVNSVSRFYATQQYSALCPDSACASVLNSLSTTTPVAISTLTTVNTNLNAAGEAKSANGYTGHTQAANLVASVTSTTNQGTFVVCWQPLSKAQKANAVATNPNSTIYNNLGVAQPVPATCSPTSSNTCYQCLKQ